MLFSSCQDEYDAETQKYVNQILGEFRSEKNIIEELGRSSAKIKEKQWRGHQNVKRLDQNILQGIESLAKDNLVCYPGNKIDYGTIYSPKEVVSSKIEDSYHLAVQDTRKKEFIKMCISTGKKQPDLSLAISSFLCKIADEHEDYSYDDTWELVKRWMEWSINTDSSNSYDLYNKTDRTFHLRNHPVDKRFFIANIASLTGNREVLEDLLSRYLIQTEKEDEYATFEVNKFKKMVELYCSKDEQAPEIIANIYHHSRGGDYHFGPNELEVVVQYKKYEAEIILEIVKSMVKSEKYCERFFLYSINKMSSDEETGKLDEIMALTGRFLSYSLLIGHKNTETLAQLKKYHYPLILGAVEKGEKCIVDYPDTKPHQFCRTHEIEKLAIIVSTNRHEDNWKELGERLSKHYYACKNKFGLKKYYKESDELLKLINSLDTE